MPTYESSSRLSGDRGQARPEEGLVHDNRSGAIYSHWWSVQASRYLFFLSCHNVVEVNFPSSIRDFLPGYGRVVKAGVHLLRWI